MEEPTRPLPADGGEFPNGVGERAPPAPVEVAVEVYGEEETGDEQEEPPRSATAKQEEAKAALGTEGSRPFTILGEIKEDAEADGGGGGVGGVGSAFGKGNGAVSAGAEGSLSSQESMQKFSSHHDVAMDLINSVTGVDEEGRSRQRILSFAGKRYLNAIERNPDDPDAYYNWALVLQESADNVDSNFGSSKDPLLEEACKKYAEATQLCPTLYDAYYNWAIAIADRAKMRGRTKEAEDLWKQAILNYEKAVQLNWNSPQALNNWGLGLQELSAIVPAREKQTIIKTAISKFRVAIQLQFDFHRAIYNLGTVLYGLAEDTMRSGRPDVSPNELYSQSAIYVAAAHALRPNYSVYRSALRLVRSMVDVSDQPPSQSPEHMDGDSKPTRIAVADIVSVAASADLTLPPGAGLCIDTVHGARFLVADSWEAIDGWLDALCLVYTIFARGKSDVLAGIITG